MEAAAIIALGTEVAEIFNKAISLLPDAEQRKLNNYFDFKDKLNEEITRADADFDDLLAWRSRDNLLQQTIVAKITRPSGK